MLSRLFSRNKSKDRRYSSSSELANDEFLVLFRNNNSSRRRERRDLRKCKSVIEVGREDCGVQKDGDYAI